MSAGFSQNQRSTGGHRRHRPPLQQTKFAAVLQHLNLGGESLDPTEDRVQRDRERFCVTAVPFQGMIASFDPFQCRIGADLANDALEQRSLGKCILRSTYEEHWNGKTVQVLVAKLIRFTRWMKRVT